MADILEAVGVCYLAVDLQLRSAHGWRTVEVLKQTLPVGDQVTQQVHLLHTEHPPAEPGAEPVTDGHPGGALRLSAEPTCW